MSSGSVFPITRIESQLYQADRFNNGSPSFDQAGFDCYDDLRRRVVKYPQPNSKCATMGFPTKRRELPHSTIHYNARVTHWTVGKGGLSQRARTMHKK